jgi:hypothetical protein
MPGCKWSLLGGGLLRKRDHVVSAARVAWGTWEKSLDGEALAIHGSCCSSAALYLLGKLYVMRLAVAAVFMAIIIFFVTHHELLTILGIDSVSSLPPLWWSMIRPSSWRRDRLRMIITLKLLTVNVMTATAASFDPLLIRWCPRSLWVQHWRFASTLTRGRCPSSFLVVVVLIEDLYVIASLMTVHTPSFWGSACNNFLLIFERLLRRPERAATIDTTKDCSTWWKYVIAELHWDQGRLRGDWQLIFSF